MSKFSYNFPQNTNIYLTNMVVQYQNESNQLIADKVCPRVKVYSELFKYKKRNAKDKYFLPPDRTVGKMDEFKKVEFGWTDASATTKDIGLYTEIPVPDYEEGKLIDLDLKLEYTKDLIDLIDLAREKDVHDLIFTAANYTPSTGTSTLLSGSTMWSEYVASNPVIEINTRKRLAVKPYDTFVIGSIAWQWLSEHPKIKSYVFGNSTADGAVSPAQFAQKFGFRNCWVGEAYRDTAKKGATVSLSKIWENMAAMLVVDQNMTTMSGSGFSMNAELVYGGVGGVSRIVTEEFIPPSRAGLHGAWRINVGESSYPQVIAADMGYLWVDATKATYP